MKRVRDIDSKAGHAITGQMSVRNKPNAAHEGTSRINSVVSNRTFVEAVLDEHVAADGIDTLYSRTSSLYALLRKNGDTVRPFGSYQVCGLRLDNTPEVCCLHL